MKIKVLIIMVLILWFVIGCGIQLKPIIDEPTSYQYEIYPMPLTTLDPYPEPLPIIILTPTIETKSTSDEPPSFRP